MTTAKWTIKFQRAAGFALSCCKILWKGVFAGVGWRCSNKLLITPLYIEELLFDS
jgi:hypothetical protein